MRPENLAPLPRPQGRERSLYRDDLVFLAKLVEYRQRLPPGFAGGRQVARVAARVAEEPPGDRLATDVPGRLVQPDRLIQAGDRVLRAAQLQVNTAQVVQRVRLMVLANPGSHLTRLPEAVSRIVQLAEVEVDLAQVVQADPEQGRVADLAQHAEGALKGLKGHLRALDLKVGVRHDQR